MDIAGLTDLAANIGALGVSILVIWGFLTERLIPRSRLDEMRDERDALHNELEIERARHQGTS